MGFGLNSASNIEYASSSVSFFEHPAVRTATTNKDTTTSRLEKRFIATTSRAATPPVNKTNAPVAAADLGGRVADVCEVNP
jgi:hypothetical protein